MEWNRSLAPQSFWHWTLLFDTCSSVCLLFQVDLFHLLIDERWVNQKFQRLHWRFIWKVKFKVYALITGGTKDILKSIYVHYLNPIYLWVIFFFNSTPLALMKGYQLQPLWHTFYFLAPPPFFFATCEITPGRLGGSYEMTVFEPGSAM